MDNKLKQVHEELIEMLRDFVIFANKIDLKYSLAAGNLLGAIRHKGFIPWDDDMDIDVPEEEVHKIIENKHLLPSNLEFVWEKHRVHPRIYNKNIEIDYFGHKNYLWIDIFPMYKSDHETGRFPKIGKKSSNYLFARNNPFVYPIVKILRFPLYIIPSNLLRKMHKNAVKKVSSENGFNRFTALTNGGIFVNINFDNLIEVSFDGVKVKAYKDYEKYLTTFYKEWWVIPKEDQRINHKVKITNKK